MPEDALSLHWTGPQPRLRRSLALPVTSAAQPSWDIAHDRAARTRVSASARKKPLPPPPPPHSPRRSPRRSPRTPRGPAPQTHATQPPTTGALARLAAFNKANQDSIASQGGVPPLIALLGGGSDNVKEHAARTLASLALNDDNRATIASAGGIPPLIALLGGSDNVKVHAVRALSHLALNDDNKATIASVGGIPPLTALLSGSGDVRNHAEQVLTQLGLHALCRPRRGRKRMKASYAES